MDAKLSDLIGRTPLSFAVGKEGGAVVVKCSDGSVFRWFNEEEHTGNDAGIWLEDCGGGSLDDLIGHEIVYTDEAHKDGSEKNQQWTFITLRSHGGTVVMRFCGESNGYYSEWPAFERVK